MLKYLIPCLFTLKLMAQPLASINYSVRDGLPQSQVYAGFQDARGYLWFGTQGGGLGRFDGKAFQTFLPSFYISAIAEDADKTLWVGTTKGAFRKRNLDFEAVQTADNQSHNFRAFAQTKNGALLIGSEKGVWIWQEKVQKIQKLNLHNDLDKTAVYALFSDEKGVWIASNKGAFCYQNDGKLMVLPQFLGFSMQAINKDKSGNYWFVTYDKGIFVLRGSDLKTVKTIVHPDFDHATCCFVANDGKIWIGTDNKGVMQLNEKESIWKKWSETENLPNNNIRQIFQDSWHNTWICTSGGGVSRLLEQNFTHFNTQNGLLNDRIYALCEGKDNTLWCAVGNSGVMSYDGIGFHKPLTDSLLSILHVRTMAVDNNGRIWLGTEGDGIVLMDSFQNQKLTTAQGLSSNHIKSLVIDKNNHAWAATMYDGIVHIVPNDDGGFSIENIKEGIPDFLISTLKVDAANRVWFGTRSGLLGYVSNRKVAKVFRKTNGVPSADIRSIAFDNQGFIYIGTAGEGIFSAPLNQANLVFSPIKTVRFYAKNIYLLQFDKQNNLWAGSEHGVEKFIFDKQKNVSDVLHFGKNEGFVGIETCHNAVLCDATGTLWFGTLNGLTKHFPSNDAQKTGVPKLHFEQITLSYQPLQQTPFAAFASSSGGIKQGLVLPYYQNNVGFNFKSVHLNSDGVMQYRWMLKGAETEWSPLSTQEAVNYAQLTSGDYVFMVQATMDGVTFSEPISAPFRIAKPFWQMLWFRILAVVLLALSIYFVVKYRENKIRAKENALREQLEMKNNLLTLEQKALQLQMNPHFIFNVLTGVQSLIVNQKTDEAREQISNFAQLMRNILSNSRKPLISLKEEIETLDGYLHIEQQSQKADFGYHIEVVQNIDIEEVKLPPMLLQPFVENALIHGISRLTRKGRIHISFDLQGETLHCCITDNGIGREKSAELKGLSPKKHQSAAIAITTERLKFITHTVQGTPSGEGVLEPLKISDILDADGHVGGTKVEVWIGVEVF
ncbi:MAG: histidine kinase [Saprospiraceae bacterium]|nr:histidine kinase [Saprospiraceae bacterium]